RGTHMGMEGIVMKGVKPATHMDHGRIEKARDPGSPRGVQHEAPSKPSPRSPHDDRFETKKALKELSKNTATMQLDEQFPNLPKPERARALEMIEKSPGKMERRLKASAERGSGKKVESEEVHEAKRVAHEEEESGRFQTRMNRVY